MVRPENLFPIATRFISMNEETTTTDKGSVLMKVVGYAIDSIIVMAIGIIGLGVISWRF
jgi:hypothetical protein